MITPTMRSIVPDELIAPLKILGKYDWVWWTMTDKSPLSTSVELRFPTDPALLKYPQKIACLYSAIVADPIATRLFELYAQSKALAEGPKLLCPTAERCKAGVKSMSTFRSMTTFNRSPRSSSNSPKRTDAS